MAPAPRAGSIAEEELSPDVASGAQAKVRRQLLPFLFVLYVVAYLDRINVGFASLQMNRALGFSDAVFGFGSGLFFIGYFIFEIPSNLILARVGARRWIARIMITWGLVAIGMMFVRGPSSFYAMRFFLGAAEAGFFPGIILYLGWWFPARDRARAISLFMSAAAVGAVVAGPASGALLTMHGMLGFAGWQWLFALEGLPAIVLGFVVALWLPDGPDDARWLSNAERRAILDLLERDREESDHNTEHRLSGAVFNWRVWLLAGIYFGFAFGLYGVTLWLPQIVKSLGSTNDFVTGLVSAIPFALAVVCMVRVARFSDTSGERRLVVVLALLIGAAGLAFSALTHDPVLQLAAISLGAAGVYSAVAPFWTIPTGFLGGTAAAGGIAMINSIGNLGGFAGPYLVGLMKASYGFAGGLFVLSVALGIAGILALTLPATHNRS